MDKQIKGGERVKYRYSNYSKIDTEITCLFLNCIESCTARAAGNKKKVASETELTPGNQCML